MPSQSADNWSLDGRTGVKSPLARCSQRQPIRRMKTLFIFLGLIATLTARAEPGFNYAVGHWPSQGGQVFYDPTIYFMVGPTGMTVPGWYMTVFSTNLTTWRLIHTETFDVSGRTNRPALQKFVFGTEIGHPAQPRLFFKLMYSKEAPTSANVSKWIPAVKAGK